MNRTRTKWVSELFLSGSRRWDINLINHLFYPHDADEVLKVHVQSSGKGDFIVWHCEKNGLFSIKSVYNLALMLNERMEDSGQSRNAGSYESASSRNHVVGQRSLMIKNWFISSAYGV